MRILKPELNITEDRTSLPEYMDWINGTFGENDLWVTLGLVSIKTPRFFIKKKLEMLERRVFMRRPGHLVRFPVFVYDQGFPHVHMMIKNFEYKNEQFPNFEALVKSQFEKNIRVNGGVQVKRMNQSINFVSAYSLFKQGRNLEVLVNAMYLPPLDDSKQIH